MRRRQQTYRPYPRFGVRLAAIACAAIGVGALVAWRAGAFDDRRVEFGSVAAWASTIVTGLAFTVALALYAGGQWDRQAAQASKVVAWEAEDEELPEEDKWLSLLDSEGGEYERQRRTIVYRLRNGSDAPVFSCSVFALDRWPAPNHKWTKDDKPFRTGGGHMYWTLPPGDVARGVRVKSSTGIDPARPILLVFTDSAGRHWLRTPYGQLARLRDNFAIGEMHSTDRQFRPGPNEPRAVLADVHEVEARDAPPLDEPNSDDSST